MGDFTGSVTVHAAARMPGGQEVAGDAWFRTGSAAGRIEWGSEGPNSYHGSLEITDQTLADIKRLVEHPTS